MIRDEYNKQLAENNKKSIKEMEGIKKLGERAYYASTIKKSDNFIKAMDFNCAFALFACVAMVGFLIFLAISGMSIFTNGYSLTAVILVVAIITWAIMWFLFFRIRLKKRNALYRNYITKMNNATARKQKGTREFYTQKKEE
ncbi:MAG: hypothetical protein J6Q38_01540 [Clostridia bacterium]|nr:hypothetical protein [Clostridia bacterium]